MPGPWQWDDSAKRYRDVSSGRFIGQRQMVTMRDFFNEAMKSDMDKLTRQLTNHEISLGRWTMDMQSMVKETYKAQYGLAIGGRQNLTAADNGRIGQMVREQYQHIYNFAEDIRSQKVSEGQIQTRARMYVSSSTQAYERGRTADLGVPKLPAYPGDGGTVCRANCQCHWDIQDAGDTWSCTWRLGAAEHCPDCVAHSEEWNPLIVAKVA